MEDAAKGILLATEKYSKPEPVNLGAGFEISIKNLVDLICELTGFYGEIKWDASRPDGQPRRRLDTSRAKKEFGFEVKTDFRESLRKTIDSLCELEVAFCQIVTLYGPRQKVQSAYPKLLTDYCDGLADCNFNDLPSFYDFYIVTLIIFTTKNIAS